MKHQERQYRNQQIHLAYASGQCQADIAREHGLTRQAISQILGTAIYRYKHGEYIPRYKNMALAGNLQRVKAAAQDARTLSEVMKATGFARGTVQKHLSTLGIRLPTQRRGYQRGKRSPHITISLSHELIEAMPQVNRSNLIEDALRVYLHLPPLPCQISKKFLFDSSRT